MNTTPPHDLAAEQHLLASLVVNTNLIPKVQDILEPGDFYSEKHQFFVKVIFDLKDKEDFVTIRHWLAERDKLKVVDNIYLADLVANFTISAGS